MKQFQKIQKIMAILCVMVMAAATAVTASTSVSLDFSSGSGYDTGLIAGTSDGTNPFPSTYADITVSGGWAQISNNKYEPVIMTKDFEMITEGTAVFETALRTDYFTQVGGGDGTGPYVFELIDSYDDTSVVKVSLHPYTENVRFNGKKIGGTASSTDWGLLNINTRMLNDPSDGTQTLRFKIEVNLDELNANLYYIADITSNTWNLINSAPLPLDTNWPHIDRFKLTRDRTENPSVTWTTWFDYFKLYDTTLATPYFNDTFDTPLQASWTDCGYALTSIPGGKVQFVKDGKFYIQKLAADSGSYTQSLISIPDSNLGGSGKVVLDFDWDHFSNGNKANTGDTIPIRVYDTTHTDPILAIQPTSDAAATQVYTWDGSSLAQEPGYLSNGIWGSILFNEPNCPISSFRIVIDYDAKTFDFYKKSASGLYNKFIWYDGSWNQMGVSVPLHESISPVSKILLSGWGYDASIMSRIDNVKAYKLGTNEAVSQVSVVDKFGREVTAVSANSTVRLAVSASATGETVPITIIAAAYDPATHILRDVKCVPYTLDASASPTYEEYDLFTMDYSVGSAGDVVKFFVWKDLVNGKPYAPAVPKTIQ